MIDVFVIGAGPSGLMMAAELIRHGLTCRIIDKAPAPSDKSKALAVQARTLEIFHHIGIIDECLAQGLKLLHFIPMHHHKKLADLSLALIQSPYPFALSLEQSKLELILIQHLEKLGCKVEREVELLSFQQNEQKVHLSLRDNRTGKIELLETTWLMGCDGAHSTVRQYLHLTFEGISFPQVFSLADLEMEWKYPRDSLVAFLGEKELLFTAPIREKNRYRVIFQLERDRDLLKSNPHLEHEEVSAKVLPPPTLEEITHLVHHYADPHAQLSHPVWMTNFSIHSRMVSRYREKRVFLIGDAAHIHSPVGGQGMNTGLQDAFNLAWKLALVHKGTANPSLLESYHEERHFVGKNLLKATERATAFIMTHSPFFAFLRNAFLSFATSFLFIQRKIVCTIAQINICYPFNQWIVQTTQQGMKTRAGKRAPDASILDQGSKSFLFSLWKGTHSFHLLLIDLQQHYPHLDAQAKQIEDRYRGLVKVHLIGSKGIHDVQGEIQERYGEGTVYLIRPDGYIGYVGSLSYLKGVDDYLKNLFL